MAAIIAQHFSTADSPRLAKEERKRPNYTEKWSAGLAQAVEEAKKHICWPQPLFAARLEKLVCHARKNGVSDAEAACIVDGLVALNFEANRAISERYHERQRIMYELSPTRRYYYLQWKGPDQKEWELDLATCRRSMSS
jgi:hypothetical protein